MEEQVEPVDGLDEPALCQHPQFLNDVGRRKRGKPEGQAGGDDDDPVQVIHPGEKVMHRNSPYYFCIYVPKYPGIYDFNFSFTLVL